MSKPEVHQTAIVSQLAKVGQNTRIWHHSVIREGAQIGKDCSIGQNVYIGKNVIVGDKVKIQNNASIYQGTIIEDGVFIGPHVVITNDHFPRAITKTGQINTKWKMISTTIKYGASLGAHTTIVAGNNVNTWAMVAAGAVVTKPVPAYAIVAGVPAKKIGVVNEKK